MQVLDKYPVTTVDAIAHDFLKLIFGSFVALDANDSDSDVKAVVELNKLFMNFNWVRHQKEDGLLTSGV